MDNRANKNRGPVRIVSPEVELQSLCDLLNKPRQPEVLMADPFLAKLGYSTVYPKTSEVTLNRNAFRELVERWLHAGSLKKMVEHDPALWVDVSEAWKPYFTLVATGATWSVTPIPSRTELPSAPREWAIRHFALLMLNPLRDRLRGPCQRCEDYYVKKRATKIYCSKRCGNALNARRSNAALAKAEKDALLKSAARFWTQWTERKHPNRSFWIAHRVNASQVRARTKTGWKPVRVITGKWVSRNASAIQKAASR